MALLAGGTDSGVFLWDWEANGKPEGWGVRPKTLVAPWDEGGKHLARVDCVLWRRQDSSVLSVGRDGRIVLSSIDGVAGGPVRGGGSDRQDALLCAAMPASQRYVCVGANCGAVELWDLRRGALASRFAAHDNPVRGVDFTCTDTYIVSGDAAGSVMLHAIAAGRVVHRFSVNMGSVASVDIPRDKEVTRSGSSGISVLRLSPFEEALLALGTDGPVVSLWDVGIVGEPLAVEVFPTVHSAPVSSLSFSPVSHLLLASAGLDGRLAFFDVGNRTVVHSLKAGSPLGALAFHSDGHTVAVGSVLGEISLFDLRRPGSALSSFNVPDSPSIASSRGASSSARPAVRSLAWSGTDVRQLARSAGVAALSGPEMIEKAEKTEKGDKASSASTLEAAGHSLAGEREGAGAGRSRTEDRSDVSVAGFPPRTSGRGFVDTDGAAALSESLHSVSIEERKAHAQTRIQTQKIVSERDVERVERLDRRDDSLTIEALHALVHEEIQNLHLEVIRGFEHQQRQIDALFRTNETHLGLLAEVARLRAENEILRRACGQH